MTIHATNLQEHLPASLQKEYDNVQEIAFFYEDYIETLIENGDFSFESYLEMQGREDLYDLHGKIESAGIYVEYSTNIFFSKFVDSVDEKTLKSTKVGVVLT
jgi:hypothetical protein